MATSDIEKWFIQNIPVELEDFNRYVKLHQLKVSTAERECLFLKQFYALEQMLVQVAPGIGCYSWKWKDVKVAPSVLHSIYKFKRSDVVAIFQILRKETYKINAIIFWGRSNAGKTIMVNALCKPFMCGYIERQSGVNIHWLSNTRNVNLIRWEEPIINCEISEDLKLLLGGERMLVNDKYYAPHCKTNRTPILMSTNKAWWLQYRDEAYINRMWIIRCDQRVENHTSEKITPEDIYCYLDHVYTGAFGADI